MEPGKLRWLFNLPEKFWVFWAHHGTSRAPRVLPESSVRQHFLILSICLLVTALTAKRNHPPGVDQRQLCLSMTAQAIAQPM
jgi:hypothetical protein